MKMVSGRRRDRQRTMIWKSAKKGTAASELIEQQAGKLREFLVQMGTEGKRGAVGPVIDGDYLEIRFPLPEEEK
jgi:hypothetical protein